MLDTIEGANTRTVGGSSEGADPGARKGCDRRQHEHPEAIEDSEDTRGVRGADPPKTRDHHIGHYAIDWEDEVLPRGDNQNLFPFDREVAVQAGGQVLKFEGDKVDPAKVWYVGAWRVRHEDTTSGMSTKSCVREMSRMVVASTRVWFER